MAKSTRKLNTSYDISEAFQTVENELIGSMMRNLNHHRAEELKEGYNWSQWQVEQLAALDEYKKRNMKRYKGVFGNINDQIDTLITMQRAAGNAEQEISILKAMKEGAKLQRAEKNISAAGIFFKINDEKINSLIKATQDDFKKAETAILRMANDQYRKIIFNAQVYAMTGATYEKAVDMATKDFLSAGINCIEYSNGARHTMADYADMALRTAQKRAYLTGEGEKRMEWGISTVIMNKRGNPCPKCKPFVGKIFIDDVWSGGSKNGISETTGLKYPLLSEAIKKGLYHPRCRDSHTTYFEGISTPPDDKYTKEELEELAENYNHEQRQQYAQRQAEKYGRLAEYSLDADNKRNYKQKFDNWTNIVEQEESKKKYENKSTIIDVRIMNFKEYRGKIDVLNENIKTKRSIWNTAIEILEHRSGTKYEDLAFINSKNGKSIINKSYNVPKSAKMNKKMKKMLKQAEPNTIIAIHNHPDSTVPSISDILCAEERGYKYGIVVGHNGNIFKYKIISKVDAYNVDFYLEKAHGIIYNNSVINQDKLADTIDKLKLFGVELEVIL